MCIRDSFSLVSLTQAIFEKLEMAAQAKELQIEFSFPDDFTMIADESRITQVIENFATNAVKYTPAGGHILVKIQTGHSGTTFSIENDSEPLDVYKRQVATYANIHDELRKVYARTPQAKTLHYYTGAHKKVIPEITIMAFVRRGW